MSAAVVASPRRSRGKTIAQRVDEATAGHYYIHLSTDEKGQPREGKVVLTGAYFKWGIKTDEKGNMVATAAQVQSKRTDTEFVYLPGLRLAGKDSVLRQRFPQYFSKFNYDDAAKLTINNFNRSDMKLTFNYLALASDGKNFVSRGDVNATPLNVFLHEINELKTQRGDRNRTDSHIDKLNELLDLFYLAQQQQSYIAQAAAPGQVAAAPASARRGRGTLRERMAAALAAGKGLNVNNFDAKGTGASQANFPQGSRSWVVHLGPKGHWLYPAFITRSDRQQNALVFLEKLGYNPQEARVILAHALNEFSGGFPVGDPGSGAAAPTTPAPVQPSVPLPGSLPQLPAGIPSALPASAKPGAVPSIIPGLVPAQPAPSVFPTTIQGVQPIGLPAIPTPQAASAKPLQLPQAVSLPGASSQIPSLSSALPASAKPGAVPSIIPGLVPAQPAPSVFPTTIPTPQAASAKPLPLPQAVSLPGASSQIPSLSSAQSGVSIPPGFLQSISNIPGLPQQVSPQVGIPGLPQQVGSQVGIPGLPQQVGSVGSPGLSSPSSQAGSPGLSSSSSQVGSPGLSSSSSQAEGVSSPVTAVTLPVTSPSGSGTALPAPPGFEEE